VGGAGVHLGVGFADTLLSSPAFAPDVASVAETPAAVAVFALAFAAVAGPASASVVVAAVVR
jgi:hypothetical protein